MDRDARRATRRVDLRAQNHGATLAALSGLGGELRDGRKLVLIAGGDGKGQNFAPLAVPVAAYCRAVLLIGRDAPALESALATPDVQQKLDIAGCETKSAPLAKFTDIIKNDVALWAKVVKDAGITAD